MSKRPARNAITRLERQGGPPSVLPLRTSTRDGRAVTNGANGREVEEVAF